MPVLRHEYIAIRHEVSGVGAGRDLAVLCSSMPVQLLYLFRTSSQAPDPMAVDYPDTQMLDLSDAYAPEADDDVMDTRDD